jgi:hypothetical protein
LSTPDGRYLQAANSGGGLLIASFVAANTWETFLFVAPAAWPLVSGSQISLDVCNANWDPAGLLVRVDYHIVTLPHGRKDPGLITYESGGAGTRVWVSGPFPPASPYPGDNPIERTFTLVKLNGRTPAPPGTPINHQDLVAVQINSNLGNTYYFRAASESDGAAVLGDGQLTEPDVFPIFVAEFNEVRSGLGWRPATVQCQTCAAVTAVVTRSATGTPITGATAVALVPSHPYQGTTGTDGRAALIDTSNRNCVPAGGVAVQASADRYQDKSVSVQVPDSGAIEVPVALDCTQVAGKVVNAAGSGIPGLAVMLRDANGNALLDESGNAFLTTTAADGSFVFNCVGHGFVQVWTPADPSQVNHVQTIGPPGWTNVTITILATCGNLVGQVIDANRQASVPGVPVTAAGGQQATTDASGGFRFDCMRPAGPNTVVATPLGGYQPGYGLGVVPALGDSAAVIIKLTPIVATEIQITLTWGAQPSDLDSHLSGPNQAGDRFHCFFVDKTPVPYVTLDLDVTTGFGPETIIIGQTPPATGGQFVAGDYHYWVNDYSGATTSFAGSLASVSLAVASNSGLTQIAHYDVAAATGDPTSGLWHVVDFTLDVNGNVTRTDVQAFVAGNSAKVL